MDNSAKKQASFLNKYARVPPSSQDWDRIENGLQLSLGSSTAVVRNIWSITNPNMTLSFQRKNKVDRDLNILDSWLDTSLLDENNRPDKVCQRGFDFPAGGLLFPTGHLNVNQDNYSGKNKIFEFFLVRVAVGKPYCVSVKSGNMIKEKKKLPFGFDSVYLIHDEDDDEDAKAFKHDYVIFENTQVLPLYIVHFEFDNSKEEAISTPICDLCQENQANIYCKAEEANFCYYCDDEHHAKLGKLINKHVRVPVSERPKSFGKCQQHPENTLEFYCAVDNEPLCVYCKISGSHSNGEKATHPLAKISEAYSKAIAESKEIDPMLERKKNTLTDMLSAIDGKIKEINQNATEVEEHIYSILQEALKMLQNETQRKLSFLIADQIEIKRQYEQIQWQQSFLRYQQDILNPAEYLHAYSRHLASRAELINAVFIPTISNIQPDMKVEGKITVISEAKTRVNDKDEDTDKITNEELATYGTGSKFRTNIFGKNETLKNAMFNSLRNVIPMQPQKIPHDSNVLNTSKQFPSDTKTKSQLEESAADQILQQISLFKPRGGGGGGNQKAQGFQSFNPAFSLRAVAEDRLTQLKKANNDSSIQSGQFFKNLFPNSLILEGEEKKTLYLNLPFDFSRPPILNQIWYRPDASTDGPEVIDLFIKKENQFPNIILFQHKDQKFGGYASHPWVQKKATNFGDDSCFLFNITKDSKLIPIREGDITYLWQGPSSFSFGTFDLQVEENFNEISSEVDVNYVSGRGLSPSEAKAFLTGMAVKFKPEIVEVYTVMPGDYF